MNSIEVSAKNVDQAIEIGLFKLNVTRDDVNIIVLDEGGLFEKAKIKMVLKSAVATLSEVELLVNEFTEKMGLNVLATVNEQEDQINVDFAGKDIGFIIGKRGEALDALQYLLNALVNKGKKHNEYKRVKVDCSGYRERREGTLKILAHRMADKAVRDGKPSKLEPMNAYERKIIHLALESRKDVTTKSENEEPNRYITIIPCGQNTKNVRDFND